MATRDDQEDTVSDETDEVSSADDGTSDEEDAVRQRGRVLALNRSVTGTLSVMFAERDVVIDVDADTALRLIAAWSGDRRFDERPDPEVTLGVYGWIGLNVSRAMGVLWTPRLDPGVKPERDRVIADPQP